MTNKKLDKILKWIDEMRMYDGDVIVNISMAELRELRDTIKEIQSQNDYSM